VTEPLSQTDDDQEPQPSPCEVEHIRVLHSGDPCVRSSVRDERRSHANHDPSESRAKYAETLNAVVDDREAVVITRSGHDPVVFVSLEDDRSLKEAANQLGTPGERASPT
jgi:prevent-host-death family protein